MLKSNVIQLLKQKNRGENSIFISYSTANFPFWFYKGEGGVKSFQMTIFTLLNKPVNYYELENNQESY